MDESEGEAEGDEDAGAFKIYHSHNSASKFLNAFIRVLIVKLPPQQLHTLWYISPLIVCNHLISLTTEPLVLGGNTLLQLIRLLF